MGNVFIQELKTEVHVGPREKEEIVSVGFTDEVHVHCVSLINS